jgi:hypothetical protein
MKKIHIFIMSIICFLIPGCSNNHIDYYASKKDKIDLKSFFDGEIEGWGGIFDYQGKANKELSCQDQRHMGKDRGILDEWFVFDDGEKN